MNTAPAAAAVGHVQRQQQLRHTLVAKWDQFLVDMAEGDAAASLPWDQDGLGGTEDPKNSMAILLDW